MRTFGTFVGSMALAVLLSAGAIAGEKADTAVPASPTPDQVSIGEVRLNLSSDYAKLLVDGDTWEESEFLNNGMLLIIHSFSRTSEHTLHLTPIYNDLSPVELVVKADDWKLVTVGKNEKMWRVERKVTFPKAAPKTAPKAEPSQPSTAPATPKGN